MAAIEILAAWALDLILGDPDWFPHPVRGIGWMIARLERLTRRMFRNEHVAGAVTILAALAIAVFAVWGSIAAARLFLPWAAFSISVAWLYLGFSTRSLSDHALRVARDLDGNDLAAARLSVARMAGRDTAGLDEAGVSRAAIESVAESGVDGILSPLFWAGLGGAPLLWAFKAVSTADSMIGHMDERYRRFGTWAARMDDAANYVPARLAFLVFPAAAWLTGCSAAGAWRIALRDHRHHASPNAGIPEAAMAGALAVRLGGPVSYDGVFDDKPLLGPEFRSPRRSDIRRSVRLVWAASLLGLAMTAALRLAVFDWCSTKVEVNKTIGEAPDREWNLLIRLPDDRDAKCPTCSITENKVSADFGLSVDGGGSAGVEGWKAARLMGIA